MTENTWQRVLRRTAQAVPWRMKRWVKDLRAAYVRRVYAFTPAAFEAGLRRLGIAPGDVLMVHSSFYAFAGFRGGPMSVIATLQAVLGSEGTLLMPTLPFSGSAVEYAEQDPLFDAERTMSRMGLITEVFRRAPGVRRSVHPTHSVAAWGKCAPDLVAGHDAAATPCGRDTPYGGLLTLGGKVLFLGVPVGTMTFFHHVEELLEPRLPRPAFAPGEYALRVRTAAGDVRVHAMRLFSLELAGHRDHAPLIAELKRRGQWREGRVGHLTMVSLRARDVYQCTVALAERGVFCYDL